MIETRNCYLLICDECPDDGTAEESEHDESRIFIVPLAERHGWLAEGEDYHVCPLCQDKRKRKACEADGGHDMVRRGAFSDGTEAFQCSCGEYEFVKKDDEEDIST